jgi:hypothetical protein
MGNLLNTLTTKNLVDLPEKYKKHRAYPLLEQWVYSNISRYDFDDIKIKACVDFVTVRFTTNKAYLYSTVKKYLTEKTKTRHYVAPVGLTEDEAKYITACEFDLTLHDVKSYNDLRKRLLPLMHYNPQLNLDDLRIVELETALDFYNAQPELLVALLKSVRLQGDITTNIRLFGKGRNNVQFLKVFDDRKVKRWAQPTVPFVVDYLRCGGCSEGSNGNFAINDKSAHLYYHGYYKMTDAGIFLKDDEKRVRLEAKLQGMYLDGITVGTLSKAIQVVSREMRFTALKPTATIKEMASYLSVEPYGLEDPKRKTKSHLPPFIESYSKLNSIKRDAFRDLTKAFRLPKSGEFFPLI